MQWKVGDKVRLTGHLWGNKHPNLKRGSQHTVMAVTVLGHVVFEGVIGSWITGGEWEIELVERAEEKKMSVDISEVNKGDKVKLTRENGDEAIFTVEDREEVRLDSRHNCYLILEMDTLEILEKKFVPVPGLYSNAQGYRTVSTQDGEQYFTCANGSWVKSTGVKGTETYNAVRQLGTWKREITF